ncbi:MAG TPA: helix-turn-helix domain-containing protein [Dehalococcoidia bacterium]|nr:helix-turn-helix domain-containing protein [Dehalococcoidia bacterium]
MGELGNTLSRARRARGITVEDAERDTHVSRRYLQALESEDFSLFPAPVYARGFLRTYSRYLGLNPEELVRVFPNGDLTVDIRPLPSMVRPQQQLINVNWLVAGLVALFLVGAGLLLLRSNDDDPVLQQARSSETAVGAPASPPGNGGTVQAPITNPVGPVQGKAIAPIRPGQLPDFVGADLASSLAVLRDNQMGYIIVEYANRQTPKGIVISQTPSAGAKTNGDASVTLYVSAGIPQ